MLTDWRERKRVTVPIDFHWLLHAIYPKFAWFPPISWLSILTPQGSHIAWRCRPWARSMGGALKINKLHNLWTLNSSRVHGMLMGVYSTAHALSYTSRQPAYTYTIYANRLYQAAAALSSCTFLGRAVAMTKDPSKPPHGNEGFLYETEQKHCFVWYSK